MPDFSKPVDFDLDDIWFWTDQGWYRGDGFMRWHPDRGFEIGAILRHRPRRQPGTTVPLPALEWLGRGQRLRLRPRGYDWAVALSPYDLSTDLGILLNNDRLQMSVPCVVFRRGYPSRNAGGPFQGSGLYRFRRRPHLPGRITSQVVLDDTVLRRSYRADGLVYTDEDGAKLTGCLAEEDTGTLHAWWQLPCDRFNRRDAWSWGPAVQDALSLVTGQSVRMTQRTFERDGRSYLEVRRVPEPVDLGVLAPLGREFHTEHFARLVRSLAVPSLEADVIRRMLAQLIEAATRVTAAGTELLASTILEAALRTLENEPFDPDNSSWKVDASLSRFRKRFLTSEWTKYCTRAKEAHRRLRHRNAHPDWIVGHGGNLSPNRREEALDDLVFLTHFYGYMILAMAGFRDLQPRFPTPVATWTMGTVSYGTR